MSDLVGNPIIQFSHNEAHILSEPFFLCIFLLFFYAYFKSKVQISCAADMHLCSHYMDRAIPYFLNPNFSVSRAKKEVCVFSVTSPKNRVGRPLLNFFSKVLFFIFPVNKKHNRCVSCPKYIMKRGLFGPVTYVLTKTMTGKLQSVKPNNKWPQVG